MNSDADFPYEEYNILLGYNADSYEDVFCEARPSGVVLSNALQKKLHQLKQQPYEQLQQQKEDTQRIDRQQQHIKADKSNLSSRTDFEGTLPTTSRVSQQFTDVTNATATMPQLLQNNYFSMHNCFDSSRVFTATEINQRLQHAATQMVELQRQLYRGEELYFQDTDGHGNLFKGWDAFIDSKEYDTIASGNGGSVVGASGGSSRINVGEGAGASNSSHHHYSVAAARRMPSDHRWFSSSSYTVQTGFERSGGSSKRSNSTLTLSRGASIGGGVSGVMGNSSLVGGGRMSSGNGVRSVGSGSSRHSPVTQACTGNLVAQPVADSSTTAALPNSLVTVTPIKPDDKITNATISLPAPALVLMSYQSESVSTPATTTASIFDFAGTPSLGSEVTGATETLAPAPTLPAITKSDLSASKGKQSSVEKESNNVKPETETIEILSANADATLLRVENSSLTPEKTTSSTALLIELTTNERMKEVKSFAAFEANKDLKEFDDLKTTVFEKIEKDSSKNIDDVDVKSDIVKESGRNKTSDICTSRAETDKLLLVTSNDNSSITTETNRSSTEEAGNMLLGDFSKNVFVEQPKSEKPLSDIKNNVAKSEESSHKSEKDALSINPIDSLLKSETTLELIGNSGNRSSNLASAAPLITSAVPVATSKVAGAATTTTPLAKPFNLTMSIPRKRKDPPLLTKQLSHLSSGSGADWGSNGKERSSSSPIHCSSSSSIVNKVSNSSQGASGRRDGSEKKDGHHHHTSCSKKSSSRHDNHHYSSSRGEDRDRKKESLRSSHSRDHHSGSTKKSSNSRSDNHRSTSKSRLSDDRDRDRPTERSSKSHSRDHGSGKDKTSRSGDSHRQSSKSHDNDEDRERLTESKSHSRDHVSGGGSSSKKSRSNSDNHRPSTKSHNAEDRERDREGSVESKSRSRDHRNSSSRKKSRKSSSSKRPDLDE